MRFKSEIERAIYAAVFAIRYCAGSSPDNSDAEGAVDDAEWAVENHRQALKTKRRR